MKIIVLVAAKGGVGKSTLAAGVAIAAMLAHPEAKVVFIDLDPQGSLTGWWNVRGLQQPALFDLAGMSLRGAKRDLRRAGLDFVIVDCPPGVATIHDDAIAAADVVIIPTGASALDLAAVRATAERVQRAGVPYGYVLNRTYRRSVLEASATRLLRERPGRLLPPVHQWVAIPTAMAAGRTVLETDIAGRAATEFATLWGAVRAMLDEAARPIPAARRRSGR